MKKFILIGLICVCSNSVIADNADFSAYNIRKLSAAERSIYGRTVRSNDFEKRLNKAEKIVLGEVQNGSIDDRLNYLTAVIESSNKGYYNFANVPQYRTYNPLGIITNLLLNRHGVMTGYTPPIQDTYSRDYYTPYYNNIPSTYTKEVFDGNNNKKIIKVLY